MNSISKYGKTLLDLANLKIGKDIHFNDDKVLGEWISRGSLGLAETYMDGRWRPETNLIDFFTAFLNIPSKEKKKIFLSWHFRFNYLMSKIYNQQTIKKSKEDISHHYDLDNHLFESFLDENMQYSCGYWKDTDSLSQAQINKMDLVARKVYLKEGMTVLDIGCGWGGLSRHLADNYGVKVTGVTLSEQQLKLGRTKYKHPNVELHLKDYREVQGKFDRIVSVGMFEHVGVKNYAEYFQQCNRLLKDDGLFLLHTIGNMRPIKKVDDFLLKYIFPNGHIPSLEETFMANKGQFDLEDLQNFGYDYSRTLDAWRDNFFASLESGKLKKDERFIRMWDYYLSFNVVAFAQRRINLFQFVFTKNKQYPQRYDAPR